MNKNKFELIVTVINRGFSDGVVSASKEAGATGGTIIYGRGTGRHENQSVMGVSLQPEKEIVLTLTSEEDKNGIMQAICEKADVDKEGVGVCFSIPVNQVRGIASLKSKQNPKKDN